ncbi:GNAT family N-acetyltransferase [Streptomyces bungoensis]|uniref:GNAT family N-acetyltransferase n=1 Tax=Streptomyces bungoensis TaxID=285568 RepID=UPI003CC69EB1
MSGGAGRLPVSLDVAAGASGPALLLRPWGPADAGALVEAYRDDALRRWTSAVVADDADAVRWLGEQRRGWETGRRFAFAVVEAGAAAPVLGHVVLRRPEGVSGAEVGYWTVAAARGRGVASRAPAVLSDRGFAAFGDAGPDRLELVHQVDNAASCRVAHKCGYALAGVLPPAPPAHPPAGHVHVRERRV